MTLSSRQFLHIIETLRSDPTRGRRANPRVGLRFKVRMLQCVECGPVPLCEVWVRDLSIEGIGFVHEEHLPIGSFVVIQFAPEGTDAGLSVLYQVLRSHQLAVKSFEIGAKLDHVLTAEELAAA
jgi:hypothetical protein